MVVLLLSVQSFIFAILGVPIFAERTMPGMLAIPVLQILGALYAIFLVPPFIFRDYSLERLWKEIVALGTSVMIFGVILSIIGLIMGFTIRMWATFFLGVIVLGMGIITGLFPYIHLFFKTQRAIKRMQSMMKGNRQEQKKEDK